MINEAPQMPSDWHRTLFRPEVANSEAFRGQAGEAKQAKRGQRVQQVVAGTVAKRVYVQPKCIKS